MYLRLAEIDLADRRDDTATNRLRHAAAELTTSPELLEQLADTLTHASDGEEKRAALTAAYQLTQGPADRARIGAKLDASGGHGVQQASLDSLLVACCNDTSDQPGIGALYEAFESRWKPEHGLLRIVALTLSGHVEQAYTLADELDVEINSSHSDENGWSRVTFAALGQILQRLPSVYKCLPDGLVTTYAHSTDSVDSISVAALPEWCFFGSAKSICLSQTVTSRDRRQLDLLFRWAIYLKQEQLLYLTRWTGEALCEIVAAMNHSLGMGHLERDGCRFKSSLYVGLQSSFESEPASQEILAALGLVNQQGREIYLLRLWPPIERAFGGN